MNETVIAFEEKLKELLSIAKKNKDVIEVDKVNDVFKELNLDPSQIDKIYEYLEANNIAVLNLSNDDEPDDSSLLELEQEEDMSVTEDLSSGAAVMSDDPVKLYLKEIGGYPLLTLTKKLLLPKKFEEGDESAKRMVPLQI